MTAWMALYICLSGCSSDIRIPSNRVWYSQSDCEAGARLIAQGMYVLSDGKQRYGFQCREVDYEPPNLKDRAR